MGWLYLWWVCLVCFVSRLLDFGLFTDLRFGLRGFELVALFVYEFTLKLGLDCGWV